MFEQGGERPNQLALLRRRERRKKLRLHTCHRLVQPPQFGATGGGQRDDVATPVGWVGSAFDEPARFEFVQRRDDIAAVELCPMPEHRLVCRAELRQRGQESVVIAAAAGAGECLAEQAVSMRRDLAEQPSRLRSQSLRRRIFDALESRARLAPPTICGTAGAFDGTTGDLAGAMGSSRWKGLCRCPERLSSSPT